MTFVNYTNALRLVGVISALGLWAVSMTFNYAGFEIDMPGYAWVGVFLAFVVTAIQLIWNKVGFANLTLGVVGLLAYLYGFYTNIGGIMAAQGNNWAMVSDNFGIFVFPFLLGIFLEVTPEPLLVWGLVGMVGGGDFFGNLVAYNGSGIPMPQAQQQPKPQQQPQPRNEPAYHSLTGSGKPQGQGGPQGGQPQKQGGNQNPRNNNPYRG